MFPPPFPTVILRMAISDLQSIHLPRIPLLPVQASSQLGPPHLNICRRPFTGYTQLPVEVQPILLPPSLLVWGNIQAPNLQSTLLHAFHTPLKLKVQHIPLQPLPLANIQAPNLRSTLLHTLALHTQYLLSLQNIPHPTLARKVLCLLIVPPI